jgi:hypothetical protein
MTIDVDNFSLSFFTFILRKSFSDEMIICSRSCVVDARLLMLDGKIQNEEEKKKKECDARTGARTLDIVVKSHTLYRLSYPGHVNTWTELFYFIVLS